MLRWPLLFFFLWIFVWRPGLTFMFLVDDICEQAVTLLLPSWLCSYIFDISLYSVYWFFSKQLFHVCFRFPSRFLSFLSLHEQDRKCGCSAIPTVSSYNLKSENSNETMIEHLCYQKKRCLIRETIPFSKYDVLHFQKDVYRYI